MTAAARPPQTYDDGLGPSDTEIRAHRRLAPVAIPRSSLTRDPQYIATHNPGLCLRCLGPLEPGRRYVCGPCFRQGQRRWAE